MSEQDFLSSFADTLATAPAALSISSPLLDLEGWDSVAVLNAMVLVEENFGVTLTPEQLSNARTPGDILEAARNGQVQAK